MSTSPTRTTPEKFAPETTTPAPAAAHTLQVRPVTPATRGFVLASAGFTAIGLVSGLYYREFTKHHEWDERSQLGVAHSHWLVLGTVLALVFALVEDRFQLSRRGRVFTWFVITWVAGVLITAGMQLVKGSLQVAEVSFADSPAIAGISGLGHMTLTAAFVLFFIALLGQLRTSEDE